MTSTGSPFLEILRNADRSAGGTRIKEYYPNVPRDDLYQAQGDIDEAISNGALDRAINAIIGDDKWSRKHKHVGQEAEKPEFIDYLNGGCQISLAVAIDYSASNGDPRQQGTPHYIHPSATEQWNDYEKAIISVGYILAEFDSDQQVPVWGFGAKYNNLVRHCFQCGREEEVEGVQGIINAYRGVFRTPLTMSYPTKFTEVIRQAADYAQHKQDLAHDEGKLSYTILLILTAGNVENVQETKEQLIEASNDPLSVVIVGIGDADFSGMGFLDAFNPATDKGRDITKFVRFNDYKSYTALTGAVLDEIPDQLVNYYFDKGIMPGHDEGFSMDMVEAQEANGGSVHLNLPGSRQRPTGDKTTFLTHD